MLDDFNSGYKVYRWAGGASDSGDDLGYSGTRVERQEGMVW